MSNMSGNNNNNKGFSLVEMLVAVAILAIVSAMALSLISFGVKFFTQTSEEIKIQNNAQIAINQIREHSIDCDVILSTGTTFKVKKGVNYTEFDFSNNTLTLDGATITDGVEEFFVDYEPRNRLITITLKLKGKIFTQNIYKRNPDPTISS